MSKNKKEILEKATVLAIKLARKHPKSAMLLNGVVIKGYQAKNYELPAGTDLSAKEVKAWFVIEKALPEEKKALKKPAQDPA